MARARNIKPGFFRNADLVELPVEVRLLFIGLWTLADREGRLEDRPRQIKMELFPADSFDVESMLAQLQASKFINRYEVDGSKFIEVENFIKHQDPHYKEKASEIPPPPGRENFMRAVAVTKTQRARILDRDGYACKACGSVDALCIDHILPVSRGGNSEDDNLQVLCSACNTKKGNKIDGEGVNSRQRRINVGTNSNQRNDASPSDSLIPDSLIPEVTPQAARCAPALGLEFLKAQGCEESHAADWLKARKAKRAPLTQTAWDQLCTEAMRAGLTPAEAVRIAAANSWQSFKAEYLKTMPRNQGPPVAGGTVRSDAAEQTKRAIEADAKRVTNGPTAEQLALLKAARSAVRTVA